MPFYCFSRVLKGWTRKKTIVSILKPAHQAFEPGGLFGVVALHRLDGVAVLQLLGFQPGDGCVVFDHEVLHRCLEQVDASLPSTFRSFSWYASSCRSSSSCDLVLLLKLEAVVEGLVVLKLHSSVFSKSLCLLFLAVFGLLPSGWLLKLHYLPASINLLIAPPPPLSGPAGCPPLCSSQSGTGARKDFFCLMELEPG